ncbi:hypothetical protein [Derxia gummosa]|uniref:Uncharacterized protein n=1 Tax=Derxia gummosa DSM 723 TaxID=1121388 RepID=A0A8B6X4H1_9BURK|nr:hypothetical protein [Derxia gummosa]
MKTWNQALHDSMLSGALASLASALVASWRTKRESGSAPAAMNATSHWYWGDRAAARDEADVKHTALGYATHHGATMVWSTVYEKAFGERAERSAVHALCGGAAVAALACFVDYGLTPKRFTPGFEKRLRMGSMAGVYGALALGLAAASLVRRGRGRAVRPGFLRRVED